MLTTHPLLVPRLRKSRRYTSCQPNAPLWSVTGPLYLYIAIYKYSAYSTVDFLHPLHDPFSSQRLTRMFELCTFCSATNAPSLVSNRQSDENIEITFLADLYRQLTESSDLILNHEAPYFCKFRDTFACECLS
jgi:hypothetical protein